MFSCAHPELVEGLSAQILRQAQDERGNKKLKVGKYCFQKKECREK